MKKILFLFAFISAIFLNAQIQPLNTWNTKGNTFQTNTNWFGTNNNTSINFKSNGVKRLKLDSLGFFTWNMGSSGSPLYYNSASLRPLPSFTLIPCFYLGNTDYRADNYAILADTNNMIYNANQTWFGRAHNVTWLQAQAAFVNNQTSNTDMVQFLGPSGFTCTSNGVTTQHATGFRRSNGSVTYSIGTVATERSNYIQGDTYSAMAASTATMTEAIGTEFTQPTAGTGMTFTNRLGIVVVGASNIFGGLSITANTSRIVGTPAGILNLGAQTSSLPSILFTTGTILTSTVAGAMEYAANVFYLTNNVNRYQAALVLTNTATLDFPNTGSQNSSELNITVTGAAVGDAVSMGTPSSININSNYFCYVSSANTVTIRFNNYSTASIDPASGTFKATVIKN